MARLVICTQMKKSQQLVSRLWKGGNGSSLGLLSKQQIKVIITNAGKGSAKTSDFIHNVGEVN